MSKNKTQIKNKSRKGSSSALFVIIGILTALIIILGISVIGGLSKGYSRFYLDESNMKYDIQKNRYATIADNVNRYKFYNKKPSQEYKELIGLADYENASFLKKAMENNGYAVKADRLASIAEDAKGRMGRYSYAAAEIDSMLEAAAVR